MNVAHAAVKPKTEISGWPECEAPDAILAENELNIESHHKGIKNGAAKSLWSREELFEFNYSACASGAVGSS